MTDAPDTQPVDYASLKDARIEAVRLVGDVIKFEPDKFWQSGRVHLSVKDEAGLTLFEIIVIAAEGRAGSR